VDDALLVGSPERVGDLRTDLEHLCDRQRPLRDPRGQRLAGEVLHDEVSRAVVAADVIERADVRMRELRDRVGLALEAGAAVGVGAQVGGLVRLCQIRS
jgi:hypothetical protein